MRCAMCLCLWLWPQTAAAKVLQLQQQQDQESAGPRSDLHTVLDQLPQFDGWVGGWPHGSGSRGCVEARQSVGPLTGTWGLCGCLSAT